MLLPQLDIFKDINYLLLDEIAQVSQEQEMEKVQNKIHKFSRKITKLNKNTRGYFTKDK